MRDPLLLIIIRGDHLKDRKEKGSNGRRIGGGGEEKERKIMEELEPGRSIYS